MLNALNHRIRRDMLRLIKKRGSITYTQILNRIELPTGKLNYQLKQLSGITEKTVTDEYQLTPLGEKAVSILESIHADGLDEYFKKYRKFRPEAFLP